MINAAIIGVSGFAQVHYNDLVSEYNKKRLNIIGATIINQEEERDKCDLLISIGCKIFVDYNHMFDSLRDKIDICFIPTGIALHAPMSIAAMRAGANVYVEKPVASTIQDITLMRGAEKETGKFIAVGYQAMYQPETRKIKEYILDGKIGRVHILKVYGLCPRNADYYKRNSWAGKLKNGNSWVLDSPFNNALAHQLNLLCFYAGKTFSSSATICSVQAGLFRSKPIYSVDTAWIKAVTDDAITLLFYFTHSCHDRQGPVTLICGQNGEIEYDSSKTIVRLKDGTVEEFSSVQGQEIRHNIMDALIDKIHKIQRFICNLDIASTQTIVCNGAHESSAICQVPSEYIKSIDDNNGARLDVINGIEDVILNGFRENRLPSINDAPWITCGEIIKMANYHHFYGGKNKDSII